MRFLCAIGTAVDNFRSDQLGLSDLVVLLGVAHVEGEASWVAVPCLCTLMLQILVKTQER